jgi:diguanylate cyclase (GGDEF)-like protein
MKSRFAAKIGMSLIVAAALSVGAIVAALSYMSYHQDRQALASERAMVHGGIEAFTGKLQTLTTDYAWWEDGYNQIIANDAKWIADNFGSAVYENATTDIAVILDRANHPVYAWDTETGAASDPSFLDSQTLQLIGDRLAKLTNSKTKAQSIYTHLRGKPALLSFAKVVAVDRADTFTPDALPTFVMGYYLTPERIAEIGKGFLIDDLKLVEAKAAPADAVTLANPDGEIFAYLDWSPSKPGAFVLRQTALPLTLYLIVFLGVMLFIGNRAKLVAVRLAASEEEAQISAQKARSAAQDAQMAARTDRLSGLPNRHGFLSHIESPDLVRAAEQGRAGVIFVDLNGFKEVNDTAGHLVGDKLLKLVSERMARLIPKQAFVARIGGDEFAAVLTGDTVKEDTPTYAEMIARSFDQPVKVDGVEYHVTCAAGYTLSTPDHVRIFEQMLHDADTAMYHAKSKRDEHAVRYHAGLEIEAQNRRAIEAELRVALKSDELFVEYQPLVCTASGDIKSAEALVRWRSPGRGLVSPAQFIPVAEACGLIHDVGLFVLKRVCDDIRHLPGITISVNVSPVQLKDPAFVEEFTKIVRAYNIETSRIEIELTENVLVENPAAASKRLAALKAAGFKISLDDFGMGFSSLGYLRQLPFDKLKVDRQFVADIGKGDSENKLLQSIALLCESLNLEIVAEGVEHKEQAELLKLLSFDLLQGWHTGRPMSLDALCVRLAGTAQENAIARIAG